MTTETKSVIAELEKALENGAPGEISESVLHEVEFQTIVEMAHGLSADLAEMLAPYVKMEPRAVMAALGEIVGNLCAYMGLPPESVFPLISQFAKGAHQFMLADAQEVSKKTGVPVEQLMQPMFEDKSLTPATAPPPEPTSVK